MSRPGPIHHLRFLWPCLTLMIASCSSVYSPPEDIRGGSIHVDQNTTQVSGWLIARGEWTIYSQKDGRGYDPYAAAEDERCVSIVDNLGADTPPERRLHRRFVVLQGISVRYADLELSGDVIDQLLPRRYYRGRAVINSCSREFVFVAHSVEVVRP